MLKEDYSLILDIISKLDKKTEEISLLESKAKLFLERCNLDEDYEKQLEPINSKYKEEVKKLNDRFEELFINKEDK